LNEVCDGPEGSGADPDTKSRYADEYDRKCVTSLIKTDKRIYPVGRLDKDTTGLLILTNDGELARHLELPSTGWVRRYRVRVYGYVTQGRLDKLEKGIELLEFLQEDSQKLAAEDLHDLLRCWENIHRMWQAEAHIRTVLFRDETRWPGYYFRSDCPHMSEDWEAFANCQWVPQTGEWKMIKRPVVHMYGNGAPKKGREDFVA